MRHNGQPVLLASQMTPNLLMIYPGARPMVACPGCGTWRVPRRRMLWPHRLADGMSRCPGSGQRVEIDLTPVQWLASLRAASREAAARRGGQVLRSGIPSPRPAASRLWAAAP
jgi:hypothetical protein